MYRWGDGSWQQRVVDAPGDTHAKEILTADADGDGTAELYVVWEGAIGQGGAVVRPVTITQYRRKGDGFEPRVVGTVPDQQMRAIAAGDVDGDGRLDLVGSGLKSGVWLFTQDGEAWKKTLVDGQSSGYEHPVLIADVDGDGRAELYVGAEDQAELRRWTWKDGRAEKSVVMPLQKGDITWNVTAARL
jgi:hypothetical protein